MARSKQSPFEDLIEVTSKLPWKISCTLAAVSYAVLHLISCITLAKPSGVGQMGSFAVKQLFLTLAMFGQFLLPVAFLIGALVSFINARKSARLYSEVAQSGGQDSLFNMSWREFEMLVEEYFRRRGYNAVHTGGNGPDGGVDVVLKKNNETYLVQCKQWKSQRLGVQAVRELHGVMAAQQAVGGFIVCAGKFTNEAKEFAQHINIRLFDGAMLHRMISEARQPATTQTVQPGVAANVAEPNCPKCGSGMVRRVARQGGNAGREFWGCSTYPRCNGIVS